MVLVRNRRPEQGHDAVASELVDGPLKAMDAVAQNLHEALHDDPPGLWILVLREVHGAHHVGEHDRHLLALALGDVAVADLPREMLGDARPRLRRCDELMPARVAVPLPSRVLGAAAGAPNRGQQRRGTVAAEAGIGRIGVGADGTVHGTPGPIAPLRASLLQPLGVR
jgi:hypothetical protein